MFDGLLEGVFSLPNSQDLLVDIRQMKLFEFAITGLYHNDIRRTDQNEGAKLRGLEESCGSGALRLREVKGLRDAETERRKVEIGKRKGKNKNEE